METNIPDERVRFVRDFESGHWSMTELCDSAGGAARVVVLAGGAGLADRSHASHRCPYPERITPPA